MQRTELSSAGRFMAGLVVIAHLLAGCLTDETIVEETSETFTDVNLSGSVGDGPIVGALISIQARNGEMLASLESDLNASYSVDIKTKGKYYPLLISAQGGTDLVTGFGPDFRLLGASIEPSKKSVANVNPFSTVAVYLAEELPGGVSKENLRLAEGYIVDKLNNGLATLVRSGPLTTEIHAGNISEIVKASEALGETIRRVNDLQQVSGRSSTDEKVLQGIASDLIDGVFDGNGGRYVDTRTSALTVVASVQVLLEAMQNELHVNDVNATARLEYAILRVTGGDASPALADLTVTAEMLESSRVGLDAANAVIDDPRLVELRSVVGELAPGMGPDLVAALVPDDYRATLDDALLQVANGSESMIATINTVSANGGSESVPANTAPTISGTPPTSVEAGSAYSFTPTATDAEGDSLTFSISGRPSWANFSSQTGTLSGTPAGADEGTYGNIVISVSDGEFSTQLPAFSVTVNAAGVPNTAPTISGTPPTSVEAGSAYSFRPTANDAEGDRLTFSISGRPSWANFSSQTGTLSGTPAGADEGIYGDIVISVSDGQFTSSLPAFAISVTVTNTAPTISGTPPTEINAGSAYTFVPQAEDADDDPLRFSILNRPAWASFSTTTGELSGIPTAADIGLYENIVITVSDGSTSASLAPFSIAVNAVSLGSVTLSWTAPTDNEDGTALTDLAGYRFYWGTTPGTYTDSVTIENPGLTSYVIENLAAGTYEFVATSFNASGQESVHSNSVIKTVE